MFGKFTIHGCYGIKSQPMHSVLLLAPPVVLFFKEKLHPTRFHKPHWITGQVDFSGTAIEIAYMGDIQTIKDIRTYKSKDPQLHK